MMLDELVARDVLIRHPVKRSYGPGERLHEIDDQRLIWGNLPLSGRDIAVFSGSHEVGRIPGQNLLKLQIGSVFALGNRRYRVTRIQVDRIDVATSTLSATLRLSFGGVAAELDPTLLEAELRLLASGGGAGITPASAADQLAQSLSVLHDAQRIDTLVRCRIDDRVHHLTFAGRLLNALIAAWLPVEDISVGEACLVADGPLDLSSIPASIEGFGELLREIDQGASRHSLFQAMLPAELLVREQLEVWHRCPVFRRTLERLRSSVPVDVAIPPNFGLQLG